VCECPWSATCIICTRHNKGWRSGIHDVGRDSFARYIVDFYLGRVLPGYHQHAYIPLLFCIFCELWVINCNVCLLNSSLVCKIGDYYLMWRFFEKCFMIDFWISKSEDYCSFVLRDVLLKLLSAWRLWFISNSKVTICFTTSSKKSEAPKLSYKYLT